MYDKEQFNKFQAKDKIEPQQTQLEPPDINWPITSHIKDKGISAITLLACSIPNKKTRTSVYNLFNLSIYGPGWIFIYSVKILTNASFRKYPYFPIEVSIQRFQSRIRLEIPVFPI